MEPRDRARLIRIDGPDQNGDALLARMLMGRIAERRAGRQFDHEAAQQRARRTDFAHARSGQRRRSVYNRRGPT